MLETTMKILRLILVAVVGLFVLLLLFVESFDRYISSDKGARWYYSDVPNYEAIEVKRTASGLRYLSLGTPDQQALVLIHGAPGWLMDFKGFCRSEELQKKYRLIIVERPGYGGTKPRKAEPSIKIQAERIAEILDSETRPALIFGHSYGAPIAAIIGALKPDKVDKVLAVSGQYDPDNEKTMQISYYIKYGIFKYLLPRMAWVSNVEKLTHPDGLREIIPLYSKVQVPVMVIHGDADTLVPYENSPFLMQLLPNAELITLEGKDHPIHMTDRAYFINMLLQL